MRTTISPGQLAAMDSCYGFLGGYVLQNHINSQISLTISVIFVKIYVYVKIGKQSDFHSTYVQIVRPRQDFLVVLNLIIF